MKGKFKLTYTQIIALGFLAVIFAGTFLLCLPISSSTGEWSPFLDCLFTATSATCVTGLTVIDTYLYWSGFGQIIILLMIQIGGLGFMTFISIFTIFMKKQISLHERKLLMKSAGTIRLNGISRLVKKIFFGTLVFESCGTLILATRFCPQMGFLKGLWYSVFHSVSAFCNAGFDLMTQFGNLSFVGYSNDFVVNITICLLIICGGIGFLVWNDVAEHKFHFSKYELHSKIAIFTTAVLIIGGTVFIYLFERNNAFAQFGEGNKWLCALFQSVTTRTAGFSSVPQASLSHSGAILTVILMFIGGSPGSTAGGIKTTTMAVIFMNIICFARNKDSVVMFKKRIYDRIVKQACAIMAIYLTAVLVSCMIIMTIEALPLRDVLFEVVSAIATVGLSTGITPLLSPVSHFILIILMYAGRLGGLSLVLAFAEKRNYTPVERPYEKIMIG